VRKNLHSQLPLVPPSIKHDHATELRAISDRLDAASDAADLVLADLNRGLKDPTKGREGMAAETVLRALVVKQMRGFSYEDLAFHLADSQTYRGFARIGIADTPPSASALQRDIKKIRPETLEEINHLLLGDAVRDGIERGRKVRVDCTVTETDIHEPADSEQLWDCVRVLLRGLHQGRGFVDIEFTDHSRRANRRRHTARDAKSKKARRSAYADLLKVTRNTVASARRGAIALQDFVCIDVVEMLQAHALADELLRIVDLADRVIDQAHRRVLLGEKVPAQDKVLSIFEPHTDIIIKSRRDVEYGHKLCLTTGASGLVTDLLVLEGNPADSTLAVQMVERQQDIYGRVPRQIAFDGGFASKQNLADIKEAGVQDVMFSKRRGLEVLEMVKSSWVYRRLKNFRAGIEAGISFLKRCFGLRRCTWRGEPSFKAYVWASVLAANLLTLARHDLARAEAA
jgi:IS5 family transposase